MTITTATATTTTTTQRLSMEHVLGNLPMFLDEQPLAFKIMAQHGHDTELSPKTYCEIAGENYHRHH